MRAAQEWLIPHETPLQQHNGYNANNECKSNIFFSFVNITRVSFNVVFDQWFPEDVNLPTNFFHREVSSSWVSVRRIARSITKINKVWWEYQRGRMTGFTPSTFPDNVSQSSLDIPDTLAGFRRIQTLRQPFLLTITST